MSCILRALAFAGSLAGRAVWGPELAARSTPAGHRWKRSRAQEVGEHGQGVRSLSREGCYGEQGASVMMGVGRGNAGQAADRLLR